MTTQPPSRWWHLVSVMLFLSGAVATPILMVFLLIGKLSSGEEFVIPGTHSIKIEKTGAYCIWNIVSEFRDGTQRDYSEKLPNGTRIRITDSAGKEIPTKADLNCTETSGNSSRKSICSFTVSEAGLYSIIVDGTSEARSFMVRRAMSSRAVLLFVLGSVVSVLGWIIPILISILVEIKRHRAKKESAQYLNRAVDSVGSMSQPSTLNPEP